MVLLIMGIVAATAVPSFHASLQYHQLESAARRLKLDFEQARHTAQVTSQPESITFTGAKTYELSPEVDSLNAAGTYTVNLGTDPYNVEKVFLSLTANAHAVEFDGYGNASVGGAIYLQIGKETRAVNINKTSGEITITSF